VARKRARDRGVHVSQVKDGRGRKRNKFETRAKQVSQGRGTKMGKKGGKKKQKRPFQESGREERSMTKMPKAPIKGVWGEKNK